MMIQNWNRLVKPGDKVWHLGDVFMGDSKKANQTLHRLNGKKRLCLGNHDNPQNPVLRAHFEKIELFKAWKDHRILLSHVPVHEGSLKWGGECVNVHGHIHDKIVLASPNHRQKWHPDPPADPNYLCLCVEHLS